MRISTRGRYGLRAMLDLALHSNGAQVALLNIAQRQGISTNYLEQVFSLLRKAGLVSSIKGAQGGYLLVGKPSDVSVGTILRALEGDLDVVDEEPEDNAAEGGYKSCIRRCVWDKIDQSVSRAVDSVSLADLMDDFTGANQTPMFYI